MKLLMKNGADVNAQMSGWSALAIAVAGGGQEPIKVLITKGIPK